MADEADLTTERDEREAPARLAASRKPCLPPANGRCFSCGELIEPGLRYCDRDCQADHERVLRARGRRGLL